MKHLLGLTVLLLFAVSLGFSQGIGLKGIGAGLGYTSVSFTSGTTESLGGFLIEGHANLGELTSGLSLHPEVAYWSASKDFGAGVDWSVSDFVINANGHYNFKMPGSVTPYVGGGLGLNFLSSTVKLDIPFFGTTEVSGSETRLGINLLGGADFAMSKDLSLSAEFRYVLVSDFNHLFVKAGFTYTLR